MKNQKHTRRTFGEIVRSHLLQARFKYGHDHKLINELWLLVVMKKPVPKQEQLDECRAILTEVLGEPIETPQGDRWILTPFKDSLYDGYKEPGSYRPRVART